MATHQLKGMVVCRDDVLGGEAAEVPEVEYREGLGLGARVRGLVRLGGALEGYQGVGLALFLEHLRDLIHAGEAVMR